jgi:hypothetical protein
MKTKLNGLQIEKLIELLEVDIETCEDMISNENEEDVIKDYQDVLNINNKLMKKLNYIKQVLNY